jgi:hypothetical protein
MAMHPPIIDVDRMMRSGCCCRQLQNLLILSMKSFLILSMKNLLILSMKSFLILSMQNLLILLMKA